MYIRDAVLDDNQELQRLLDSTSGFMRVDVGAHLYVKLLQPDVRMGDQPVYISAVDL